MMTPSVGRIVHFRQGAEEARVNASHVHPAIITCVHSDEMVNLKVFLDDEKNLWATSVRFCEAAPAEHNDHEQVCYPPPKV